MRKHLIAVTLVTAVVGSIVAPTFAGHAHAATQTNAHPAFLDKTRFVAHLGVAYFAFHHWVWNPYKAGAFKSGAKDRIKNMIKGGVALLVAVHEVSVARDIANKSSSKTLKLVVKPVNAVYALFGKVGNELKKGVLNVADLTNLNNLTGTISSAVGGIHDIG